MKKLTPFLLFLFFIGSCELLPNKKSLIAGQWQVSEVNVPGGEIAAEFLKSLVPGASILSKTGILDLATNFLLKEAQEKILKSSFHFQTDGKLDFSIASQKVEAATWRYERAKEQIILENNGIEIPLQIEFLSKEKMELAFVYKEQKMKLTLVPSKF